MTPEERAHIVEVISREKEKLKFKINELKDLIRPEEPDCAIGRVSRMDAINNKSIAEASMRNLKARLDQLQKISQVVYDDDYGICTECRRPIPIERLEIRPEVRKCAACLRA